MGDQRSPQGQSGLDLLSPRARQLLALEFGSKAQFDDPRLEWRRLFSELLGTFLLVLVAAGGGIMHARGQITLADRKSTRLNSSHMSISYAVFCLKKKK